MLVGLYDQKDAYNEYSNEYDEALAQMYWEDFTDEIEYYLSSRIFPLQLIAINSNWRGQTGYATVDSIEELIQKVASFDSNYYELHKIRNAYEFRLATHDVPTGFTIQIRSI